MKTRKAAMPVPYIITLIIGVVVVAVLAYWFVSSAGKGGTIGKEAECTARKVEFCASQTADAKSKVNSVCKDGSTWDPICFCPNIIPTWKPVGDPKIDIKKEQNTRCKPQT